MNVPFPGQRGGLFNRELVLKAEAGAGPQGRTEVGRAPGASEPYRWPTRTQGD